MDMTKEQLDAYDVMIEEILDNAKETAKKKLREAVNSGALSDDSYVFSGKYILPKMIVTLTFDNDAYAPPYEPQIKMWKKEIKNLKRFI